MANVRATTAQTLVSILGSINGAAGMVAKTIDSVSSSVDMLDTFVQRAKQTQRDTNLVEDHHWRRNLVLDASREQEKKETAMHKEYGSDPQRAVRFNNIVADLEALFAPSEN